VLILIKSSDLPGARTDLQISFIRDLS